MSHMLSQRGCSHLLLERGRIAERWRTERWDGLRFQFPNWSVRLPDFPFPHDDPEAFATSEQILNYLTAYATFVNPPIRCGVTVTGLRRDDSGSSFLVETSGGLIAAATVVIATGPYQRPVIPELLRDHPGLFQVHASRYRDPSQLPSGAVLIVGSGASGAQIAEEFCGRVVACIYRSDATAACHAGIADAISSGGWVRWASTKLRSKSAGQMPRCP